MPRVMFVIYRAYLFVHMFDSKLGVSNDKCNQLFVRMNNNYWPYSSKPMFMIIYFVRIGVTLHVHR